MKRIKPVIIFLCFLLISASGVFVQHAEANNDTWSQSWETYVNYDGHPQNLSTTTVGYGTNGHCTTDVELVTSIYSYHCQEWPYDTVYFKVAVYVKAIADPGYQPQYAEDVSIHLDKIGSDQEHTLIHMINNENPPGYSQGYGLSQSTSTSSYYDNRAFWALKLLEFAAGLAYDDIGTAIGLIDLATAFVPSSGIDFRNAAYTDSFADSWWHNPGYHWTESPVRQYCFNSFRWKQDPIQPSSSYGLKISATVSTSNPDVIPTIWAQPIYLYINAPPPSGGGGGGLCPTLFVWNGTGYVEEGLLNIHADSDVTVQHRIQSTLALENGFYKLQLRELDNFTSHIDQVKLYAVDYKGEWHLCPLTYAHHSELGRVTWKLLFDDENRVDLTPTQAIDLKFLPSIPYSRTAYFIFEINGYNPKTEE